MKSFLSILDGTSDEKKFKLPLHSSEIRGLCLRKCPRKMLQNLAYLTIMRKPKIAFSIFHFMLLYFFPNECPGQCRHRPGHSLGEKQSCMKWKKQLWVFVYMKYGKFWSILVGHFIKHKPLKSEEWHFLDLCKENYKYFTLRDIFYTNVEKNSDIKIHFVKISSS